MGLEQMPGRLRAYEEELWHSRVRIMHGVRDICAELWEHTNNNPH